MQLGVCYYPEHWPEERWELDAELMAQIGLTHVRIGEFAWAAYEPARGRFDWAWLDRAIDVLAGAGLRVVLGTPTATPPIWLALERPEILAVTEEGRRRPYGTRRHTCPTSVAYREESQRIVTALVDRYGGHPAVVAWQVDNEPGNHDSARCWCDACERAFTAWLAARYASVDELNAAWGTVFWSQVYPSVDAVRLPRSAPTAHNPSLLLAHRRFASDQVVTALAEQYEIIRTTAPQADITTNFYAGDTFVDYRKVAMLGGIGAIDSYPHGVTDPAEVRFWHDLARGLGGTGRGWIMEQQPGAINWTELNPPVPDGQVALWLEDAAADGIELTLLFRWRAALTGGEQYHTGLLRHDGSKDRGFHEVNGFVSPAPPAPADVALLYDYEDAWAVDIEPHRHDLTHRKLVVAAHAALRKSGRRVDVVGPDTALDRYRWLLLPGAQVATPAKTHMVERALAAGLTVVLGPRTFTRTVENTAAPDPVPVGLARLARVIEGLSQTLPVTVEPFGVAAGPWTDVLEPGPDGEVLATYGGGTHLDGAAAVVRTPVGTGSLVSMGASSTPAWAAMLDALN